MSDRQSVLYKCKLKDFTDWLTSRRIDFNEGKGSHKVLNINTPSGWQILFEKESQPDTYVVNKYLAPLVREFNSAQKANGL